MKMRFRCEECEHHCTITTEYEEGYSKEIIELFKNTMCRYFGKIA